jgi:uncharacterized protein YegJ (DUF2314 family)
MVLNFIEQREPMKDNLSSAGEEEPVFSAVSDRNPEMQAAYAKAAATIPRFIEHTHSDVSGFLCAKLRFRDPDESERLGENRFLFLWLTGVEYHADEELFSGVFFEVPREFQKWHRAGDRLDFHSEDIFDWMMLTEDGQLFAGYTLRVTRSMLPESDRADYDKHIGVRSYEE